jgi:hypothetical protein
MLHRSPYSRLDERGRVGRQSQVTQLLLDAYYGPCGPLEGFQDDDEKG